MNKALVSIIVPVYNAEQYLQDCIQSVLALHNKSWQLILVNDGSKDKSAEICKEYCKNDTRILYLEQDNAGVSAARNNGIKHAEGEWITFLDSDDMLSPSASDIISIANSDDDLIIASYTRKENDYSFSEKNQRITGTEIQKSILNLKKFKSQYSDIAAIDDYNRWSCWGRFYRTEKLKEQGIEFPEGIKLGEDLIFCMRYSKTVGNILINESRIYFYRRNQASVSQKFHNDRVSNTIKMMEEVEKSIKEISLKEYYNTFVIDRITKCCLDYYTNPECSLSRDDTIKELKNLCEIEIFKNAVSECHYSNLAMGKKNAFYNGVTLFYLKRKRYKSLLRHLKILKKHL